MTGPRGEELGEAHVDVGADFSRARKDTKKFLDDVADDDYAATGEHIGTSVGDGMDNGIRKSRPKIKKAVEEATQDLEEIPKERVRRIGRYFRDKATGEVKIKYFLEELAHDAMDFVEGSKGQSEFNRVGQGIRDAIGAGFNISGKSPLVAILVPVVGMIAHLIAALLPMAYALTALLYTLPGLLVSIGLQVGVLFFAFKGLGTAIQGAFAAKNANELNEAIQGLTPSAQRFVRTLLPLRDLFTALKASAQESFFKAFGTGPLYNLIQQLSPILRSGIPALAAAMGKLLAQFTEFFSSPSFTTFLKNIIPATLRWLERFGPALVVFLTGLIDISNRMLPLLEYFGRGVAKILTKFGEKLSAMARDPETQKFIEDAKELVRWSAYALAALAEFIGTFIKEFSKGEGKLILSTLVLWLKMMTEFLKSPLGKTALKGLAETIILLSALFVALFVIVGIVFAALAAIFEFLSFVVISVGTFIGWLWGELKDFWRWLTEKGGQIMQQLATLFSPIMELKKNIEDFFSNADTWLINAGKDLVRGFKLGIESMIPGLGGTMTKVMQKAVARYMPGSPAEVGPLSGSGYTYLRGRALVDDFARGIQDQTQTLNQTTNRTMGSISFGPGAVRVDMSGTNTTPDQARVAGSAVGNGAIDAILTRLAVRTL